MNDEKQRLKLLKKKTMLFWNKQNSLHLLLLLLYLSLFYLKKQQNQNPNRKKNKSHPKQPCKSLYPCTTISIKNETKIRQLPPPLLTSKQLQTNSLDNMRS